MRQLQPAMHERRPAEDRAFTVQVERFDCGWSFNGLPIARPNELEPI